MNKVFSIGKIAKLKGTTVKTLRYYDQINLLKPSFIDDRTGYRHYTYEQLFNLEFILMLKNSGVPLKDISTALQQDDWLGVITLCESQIVDAQAKLAQVQEALFKFKTLHERICQDQINTANKGVYIRNFPERSMISADCIYPPDHDVAYEVFTELYKKIRDDNLSSFYATGYVVGLGTEDLSIHYKKAFVEAYPYELSSTITLQALPAGTYFCVSYSSDEKETQLSKILNLLHLFNKEPELILECDTFYTTREYKNQVMELQVFL